MIDITRDEIWNSDDENKVEEGKQKKGKTNKLVTAGAIAFFGIMVINCVLIYSFFTLLSKI